MRGSRLFFFLEVARILALFAGGSSLAYLAGASEERSLAVGAVTLCAYLVGRATED